MVLMAIAVAVGAAYSDWAVPVMAADATEAMMGREMLPPNAKPGECYARVCSPNLQDSRRADAEEAGI